MIKKISSDFLIKSYLDKGDYAESARHLLILQKRSWMQLKEGYESLRDVKERKFLYSSSIIKIQFNPLRKISSSAKVDPESVKLRKCFLCIENLPAEQEGVVYRENFIILANPYPIFPEHFTVSSLNHIPQSIFENFRTMLLLIKDLSKYYTVFYNGPRCGASAPDHLHFQACSKLVMPIELELSQIVEKYSEILLQNQSGLLYSVDDGIRKFFVVQSKEISDIEKIFNYVYSLFQKLGGMPEEPMMNLIVNYNEEKWRLIIFLREKHRPAFYYKGILWSPAAVDLGGLCIFPIEKDLNVISGPDLAEGFKEVIISDEIFSYIKKKLKELEV